MIDQQIILINEMSNVRNSLKYSIVEFEHARSGNMEAEEEVVNWLGGVVNTQQEDVRALGASGSRGHRGHLDHLDHPARYCITTTPIPVTPITVTPITVTPITFTPITVTSTYLYCSTTSACSDFDRSRL